MSLRPGTLALQALWEQYNPRTGHWLSDTKDILLRFFQQFFHGMPAGQNCYHFEPGNLALDVRAGATDEKETEIIISDQGPVNTNSVEKRPAVILSRGPFAWGNTSLDQLLSRQTTDDKRTHTDLITGSFVVNCVARNGLEAETLALMVAKAIRIYRRELQKAGFFYIGHMAQVGTESPAGSLVAGDSAEDFINVPVTLPAYYEESWTVERPAELLQHITMKVIHVARTFSGSPLVPGSIDSEGNPVEGSEGVIVQAWQI